jgi:hypothetical protein
MSIKEQFVAFNGGISINVEDPWITDLMMNLRDKGNIDDALIFEGDLLEDLSFHTSQDPTPISETKELYHQTRVSWPADYYEPEEY